MSLQINIKEGSGTISDYWKVEQININKITEIVYIVLVGYLDSTYKVQKKSNNVRTFYFKDRDVIPMIPEVLYQPATYNSDGSIASVEILASPMVPEVPAKPDFTDFLSTTDIIALSYNKIKLENEFINSIDV